MNNKKLKKRSKKGESISDLQEKLLITPEKMMKQIEAQKAEEEATKPKKVIEVHGDNERDQIESMTIEEMSELLINIKGSPLWIAYKKYIGSRMQMVESALYTMDPYKQSTETARNQGIRMGLMDFEGYLISLEEHRKNKENS